MYESPKSNLELTIYNQNTITNTLKPGRQSKSHLPLLRDPPAPPKRRRLHPSLEPKPANLAARSSNSHQTGSESKCVAKEKTSTHSSTQQTNTTTRKPPHPRHPQPPNPNPLHLPPHPALKFHQPNHNPPSPLPHRHPLILTISISTIKPLLPHPPNPPPLPSHNPHNNPLPLAHPSPQSSPRAQRGSPRLWARRRV